MYFSASLAFYPLGAEPSPNQWGKSLNEKKQPDPRTVLMIVLAVSILAIAGAAKEVQLAVVALLITGR